MLSIEGLVPLTAPIKPSETRIGWIGIGVMGAAMSSRLISAGYTLSFYARNPSHPNSLSLQSQGAKLADSPSHLTNSSDVVFTMLGHPSDVKSILLTQNGVVSSLNPNTVIVDTTSSHPDLAREISTAARAKNAWSIDAPVSGGDIGARDGKLAIFAAGEASVVEWLQPLFNIMGKATYMGPAGNGQSCKIANQITIGSNLIGLSEGLVFAKRSGLDLEQFVNAIKDGSAGTKALELFGKRMINRDYKPGGHAEYQVKDLGMGKLPELKLDSKQAQGFLSFFKTLPDDPRAIRFFDRRDYYTAHGENATLIAKKYYHTTTALRQLGSGSNALSSVSVSRNMFETVARDLLLERTDHTLEVYEGSGSNWRLVKSGTPGNIGSFEEVLFANSEMQDSPVVVALSLNFRESGCTIGLGFVNLTKRLLGMAEFLDDSHFTNVESALVALGCKECLVPIERGKSIEYKMLCDVLTKCGVMLTERKKSEFKTRDLVQDLGRLVKGSIEAVQDLVSGFEFAPGALGALLSYADLLADESNYENYTLRRYNLDSYMRLDSAAMRALNVLESKTDANKNFSLFGLMNRTCTAGMGKRLLNMWLKQPLVDVNEINSRLDVVQAFVEDTVLRQDLRQHLKRISDIERLVHNLQKRRAGLQHVVKLYQSSIRLPYIKSALDRYDGQFSSMMKSRYLKDLELWTGADRLNKFIELVETAVDLDYLENGEYMISSSYDSALTELKEQQELLDSQIHDLHRQTAVDLDLVVDKALKLDKGTQFGHVFRITKKEEPKIRKKLNTQFIVLETRKDGVKFTNTKLKKLGDKYQQILEEYKSCQKQLVNKVVELSATFSVVFESLAELISELDVLLSFADLASSCPTPYTRPDITSSDKGDIVLEGSRHPCVEAQDWVNFIPNDCKLIRGKSWFQIITGPNMGGKSTFIRQVGVNILMAQVGCFVPCDKASISVRDCIFARVGAGDCQLRGISTFMQEMLETSSILKGATDKSLVIIDELGRGTSTYDGFGLAWAICEHIVDVIKAPTLFATHFHELTALAHENDPHKQIVGVANYHVSAHIDASTRKLTMLYKVEPGACDQSFGIHVAEFANFPESVVALAREKAAELEDFSSSAISLIDSSTEEVGSKRKRAFEPDDISKGAAKARQILEAFVALPLDTMDKTQALQEVKKLKDNLEKDAQNCHWLQKFL